MTNKFTPGPWHVGYVDCNGQAVVASQHLDICKCFHHCVTSLEKEMVENARLIAAAPTLLMALEFLLDQCEGFNVSGVYFNKFKENRDALDTAYAAIAKATEVAA